MEWYGPLTVLPAVRLLIMSTTNFIVSLNSEIIEMGKAEKRKEDIIMQKLGQLRRLGIANASMYAAALLFLIAGLSEALLSIAVLFKYLMIMGVISTTVGLSFLFIHSFKSVKIRQKNLELEN